nr:MULTISPECIES: hypothetical protein [Myxococcaceae]
MVCFVLSSLTLFRSLQDLVLLAHLGELRDYASRPASAARELPSGLDPEVERRALEAQVSALEPMREPRALILVGLAGACFLCIGAAGHLLRRAGMLPREGMRQLLGRAALAAAFLRTVDGAQLAVVWRRMGTVGAELMDRMPGFADLKDPALAEQVRTAMPAFFSAAAVVHTALVAGLFLLLAQYFRSERVRALVAAQEPQLGRDA